MSSSLRELIDDGLDPDEVLFRIVQSEYVNFVADPVVAQSNAFQDQPLQVAHEFGLAGACASVAVKSIWEASGASADQLLSGFPSRSGVAWFTVGQMRDLQTLGGEPCPQGIMRDPRKDSPWHAVLWDLKASSRSKAGKRAIGAVAQWYKLPERP